MDNARVFARVTAVIGEYDEQQNLTHRILSLEPSDREHLPSYVRGHCDEGVFKVRLAEQATREVSVGSWLRIDLAIASKEEAERAQKTIVESAAARLAEECARDQEVGIPTRIARPLGRS